MRYWKSTAMVLGAVCAVQAAFMAGWLTAQVLPAVALAQDTTEADQEVYEEAQSPRLLCRQFRVDLDRPTTLETADRTSEIGQWVGGNEDKGWILYTVDFETAQKSTGFPVGWVQVCMYPQ